MWPEIYLIIQCWKEFLGKSGVLWICSPSVISSKIIHVLANSTKKKREKKYECYKKEHALNNNMITKILLGIL